MKVTRYPFLSSLAHPPSVVTVGNFDGLHLGHQRLLERLLDEACSRNLASVLVTMQPSPKAYFGADSGARSGRILSFRQKHRLLCQAGLDELCVLNFNDRLANMDAEDFMQQVLWRGLGAAVIVIGDDFRFGKGRRGDVEMLQRFCQGKDVLLLPQNSVTLNGQRVSSTAIREALQQGRVDSANAMLGRPYSVSGRVRRGKQLGRTLGFPTLNLTLHQQAPLNTGIYVASVECGGRLYCGVASVGLNPTTEQRTQAILEVHLFDFNADVYAQRVEVFFHARLRNEVKFSTLSALQTAIADDVRKAREFFASTQE